MSSAVSVGQEVNVVDELDRLAQLRERDHISSAEYDEVKQQLLRTSRRAVGATQGGVPAPDGAYLLYRLIASWLRRVAAAMAVVALLFGLVAGWSGLRYLEVTAQAEATEDAAIVQGLGVRIPDPRPTIERATLEAKATAYGGLGAATGVVALSALFGALFVRPTTNTRRPTNSAGTGTLLGGHSRVGAQPPS